jgi:tight adherence protein B
MPLPGWPGAAAPWPALACAAGALAVAVAPGSSAVRFGLLWPRPGRRWRRPGRAAAPTVLSGLAGLLLLGPAGGLVGVLIFVAVRRQRARHRAAVATAAAADQLADALRRMVDELRAGHHPVAVLTGARADGPLAGELFDSAAVVAELGDGVPRTLRRAAAERADIRADVERIAQSWSVSERHGIPLADLLTGAQLDIRWRVRFTAAVRAQLAGPRATASVLTALPAVGLGLGQLLGADPVGVLRGGLLGQFLLLLGVGLAAAGMAWSEHILRAAVPR